MFNISQILHTFSLLFPKKTGSSVNNLTPIILSEKIARLDTSALLNRTSTYLFWVSRYTTVKLNLEENVWGAKVGSYSPP